jgi:hypothetical protein
MTTMKLSRVIATAAIAINMIAAEQPEPARPETAASTIKGADTYLMSSVSAVGDRIAGILRTGGSPGIVAVRADEATRSAEALARAQTLLSPEVSAARGRAWRDIGLGAATDPQDLVNAIALDIDGVTFDASRKRLLVDPARLRSDVGHADPDEDADASILLTTGVAPDEPVVGHYLAHALLDGPSPEAP